MIERHTQNLFSIFLCISWIVFVYFIYTVVLYSWWSSKNDVPTCFLFYFVFSFSFFFNQIEEKYIYKFAVREDAVVRGDDIGRTTKPKRRNSSDDTENNKRSSSSPPNPFDYIESDMFCQQFRSVWKKRFRFSSSFKNVIILLNVIK